MHVSGSSRSTDHGDTDPMNSDMAIVGYHKAPTKRKKDVREQARRGERRRANVREAVAGVWVVKEAGKVSEQRESKAKTWAGEALGSIRCALASEPFVI